MMRIREQALDRILTTRRMINSKWWNGHRAGSLELMFTKSGDPLNKLRRAVVVFFVGVDQFLMQDQVCPPENFKYKIRALHRAGVRSIKFEFDFGNATP